MPPLRYAGLGAVTALAAAALTPATVAAAGPDPAQAASPVQILQLTDSAGRATEAAEAGVDGAEPMQSASPAASPASSSASQDTANGAGTSNGPTILRPDVVHADDVAAEGDLDPQTDATVLTDPLDVDPFLVAGFSWQGSSELPEGVAIYVRVREDGVWSDWYRDEPSAAGRDDGAGVPGTEEFITGGADAVQASVTGSDSALPADLRLILVPGEPTGEEVLDVADLETAPAGPTAVAPDVDTGAGHTPAPAGGVQADDASYSPRTEGPAFVPTRGRAGTVPAAATAEGPPVAITSRSEWGADPAYMSWDPQDAEARHVIVHHTVGTNDYDADQSASIVRGIYYYHAVTLGWGDIGYNFLVDKYGTVFEGRDGTLSASPGTMTVGAHAYGANTGTMGISMMGTYTSVSPSDAQLTSVGAVAGWFLDRAGVDSAVGSSPFTFHSTQKYSAGQTVDLATISGHRDVGRTLCPGDVGYAKLEQIRSIAQAQLGHASRWVQEDGVWYYRGADGTAVTGWLFDGGRWYWLDPADGAMVTGVVLIDGRWSGFTDAGVWTGYTTAPQQGLREILVGPTAERESLIETMTSVYEDSGRTYPTQALAAGGAPTPRDFFTILYDEAVAEGVSPELLYVQVLKETGWLQFTGDVKADQFNFGGLGTTGDAIAGASFPDVRTGLRAQVQHMRAYADPDVSAASLANPLVDPRFDYVRKGSARYVQYLGAQENPDRTGWATAPGYGDDLVSMMDRYFG